jgi:hypothetical protein
MGLVVPSGLSTDHGSAPLRRLLFSRCAIDGIVGFDNAARIFPIHRSVRFQLLTATTGEPTREIPCRLGERDPAILDSAPELAGHDWFPVRISPALLERLTGDDLALPDFRREVDVRIAERASTLFAPLADPQGWGARFGRELNATEDRGELRARERRGFPVVEGKMLSPFCVDQSAATLSITAAAARRLFGERCFSPRLAYRDVASATNRVTLIAAVLPAHAHGVLPSNAGRRAPPALSLRDVQQPGRQLPRAAARDDACDDRDRGAAPDPGAARPARGRA